MDKQFKRSGLLFGTGFSLLCLLAVIDLITTVRFAFHGSINGWIFPAALVLTLSLNWFLNPAQNQFEHGRQLIRSSAVLIVTIAVSILISTSFYDLSFDGQTYHQEAIYQLIRYHWNPFFETLSPRITSFALWINHYPKQSEISAAIIYAFTGKIESGKCMNILLLVASFCLILSYLREYTSLSNLRAFSVSILFAFNPITIHQLFTFMVDGQLASLLLCLLAVCLLLYQQVSMTRLVLLGLVLVSCINIKFTAIVFAAIFVLFTLLLVWIKGNKTGVSRIFLAAAAGTMIAVLVVGFNPFVINTLKYGNVFYPLMGNKSVDIIGANSPASFKGKNRFDKLFISLFSHTENIDTRSRVKDPGLKTPFTFNKTDIRSLSDPDVRIGGFGPLFGGIVLLGIFFSVIAALYLPRQQETVYLAGFAFMLLFSVLILQECWWARYVPQLWFAPLLLLVLVDFSNIKWIIILKNITYTVIYMNLALCMYMILQTNVLKSAEIAYQLDQFQALNKPISINFHSFEANRVRLEENGIRYIPVNTSDSVYIPVAYSEARVQTKDSLPRLPAPWLVVLADRIKKGFN